MNIATPPAAHPDLGVRILKVNHAGENGAIHIYAAQAFVARLTSPRLPWCRSCWPSSRMRSAIVRTSGRSSAGAGERLVAATGSAHRVGSHSEQGQAFSLKPCRS
ncbi:demethoxyubiquinone hydroxylase family protein [Pelomonas sp. BJYL3]|uniref:demethoxyubiquinone hydroxylase family protein n=1 Tax=Pelomonas sp. BJYL3 TaxID=2976697 RepID=UPI0022B2FF8F|nr:demethoxyubiquinone hydroxylase family protein [Pelomonas sp. BJYL3]